MQFEIEYMNLGNNISSIILTIGNKKFIIINKEKIR